MSTRFRSESSFLIAMRICFAAQNTFFFIMGISLVTLSLLFIVDRNTGRQLLATFIEDDQLVELIITIGTKIATGGLVIGLILSIVASLGCFGTIKHSESLLLFYITLVIVLTIVTFSLIVAIAVNKERVAKRTYEHLSAKLSAGYDGRHTGETSATLLIDAIQIQFECCGIESFEDYSLASSWTVREYETYENLTYPATCCTWHADSTKTFISPLTFADLDTCMRHSQGESVDETQLAKASNYSTNCRHSIQKFLTRKMNLVFVITSLVLVIQFTSIIAALAFRRETNKT